ncbi:hypothetical protein KIH87_14315 [Paraneptunicella aestuarii]|uniref:hypothetical protein n=1 Tax=Paraneptunicella aestuarii TaxID=2831148 RepID=UPI001E448896|nr:hypothetical protein [Paraneptunicella aestuarii]UAA37862.1 hypothetical protein KIH87_14315 [Paraneptunicella aestuarii]
MPQSTQAFFDKYAKAYRAYDANAVAELYFIPAVIMSDDNKDVFTSTQDVVMYIERLMERLRKIGAVDFVPDVCQTMRLSDNIQFTNVKWNFYAEENKRLFSCYVSYTLQSVGDDLKVIVTVMDDEERELAKLL